MILKQKPKKAFMGMALGAAKNAVGNILDNSTQVFNGVANMTDMFANQATAGGAFSMAGDTYNAARNAEPMYEEGGMLFPYKRKRRITPPLQKYAGGGLLGKVMNTTNALGNIANAAIDMAQANKMNRKWAGYEAQTDEFGNALVNEDLMKDQAAMNAPKMKGIMGLATNWIFKRKAKKQAEAQAEAQKEDYGRQHFASFGNFNRQQDATMAAGLQPASAGISPVANPATMPSQASIGMAKQGGRLPERMFFGGLFGSLMQAVQMRRQRRNGLDLGGASGIQPGTEGASNTLDINLKVDDNSDNADVTAKTGKGIKAAADGNTSINEDIKQPQKKVEEACNGTKMSKGGKSKKTVGKFVMPGKPSKTLIRKAGGKLEEPGAVNVVVKGKLHKENNNLGNRDKGVPVVSPDGTKTYEVEKQELIFRKEATDLIEAALKDYDNVMKDNEKLAKLGAALREEILTNTQDNDGKFGVKVKEEEEA